MEKMLIQIYEIQDPREAEQLIELGVDHIGSVILDRENWRQPALHEVVRLTAGTASRSSLIPLFSETASVLSALEYYQPDIVHFCENIPLKVGDGSPLSGWTEKLYNLQSVVKEHFPAMEIIRSIPIPASILIPKRLMANLVDPLSGPIHEAPPTGAEEAPAFTLKAVLRDTIVALVESFAPVTDFFMTDTLLGSLSGSGGDVAQPVAGFVGITGEVCDWDLAAWLVRISPRPVILAGGLGPENVFAAAGRVQPAGVDSCTMTNARDPQGQPIRFQKDYARVKHFVEEVRRAEKALFPQLIPDSHGYIGFT